MSNTISQNQFLCSCGRASLLNHYLHRPNSSPQHHSHSHQHHHQSSPTYHGNNNNPNTMNNAADSSILLPFSSNNILKHQVKMEFLHYCQNSTIRGVPRIVKARNRAIRTLWVMSFISLVLALGSCLYLLVGQFLEYNVIHPPRIYRDEVSDFPAVTVCNSRPLSKYDKDVIEKKNWRTPQNFRSNVNNWAVEYFYYRNLTRDYFQMTSTMQFSTYLESLPTDEDRMTLGKQRDTFIIYCQVSYRNGSLGIATPCQEAGEWHDYMHAFFVRCSTFNLRPELRTVTRSIEMYLYLQESNDELECIECNLYDIKTQVSGAVLSIDRPDIFPEVNEKSIILEPGTLTEIRLKTFKNQQVTPPYGRCSKDTPEYLRMFDKEFVYSEQGCKEVTMQLDIQNKCNCSSIEHPYNFTQRYPFCYAMPSFINASKCSIQLLANQSNSQLTKTCTDTLERVLKNVKCKKSAVKLYYKDVIKNCSLPCTFLSYENDRSISKWPTKSFQLKIFDSESFQQKKLIERPEFQPYRKIIKLKRQNRTKEASMLLEKTNVLENNVLAIIINKPNDNLNSVEEKEVLSLTSFMSQVGGLFSIWIGLSMISIVEIVELFVQLYQIIRNSLSNRRNTNIADNTNITDNDINNNSQLFTNQSTDILNNNTINIKEQQHLNYLHTSTLPIKSNDVWQLASDSIVNKRVKLIYNDNNESSFNDTNNDSQIKNPFMNDVDTTNASNNVNDVNMSSRQSNSQHNFDKFINNLLRCEKCNYETIV